MPASVPLRRDFDARHLRKLASRCKDARQSRRLLSLAAVYDGMSRGEAARIGGMDRQTLRDWVHRFNEEGPDGLTNRKGAGPDALPERCPDERTWRDCRDRPRSGGGRGCPLAADRPEAGDRRRALASSIPSAEYPDCLANWALPISAPARSIPGRISGSSRRLKKTSPTRSRCI